MCNIRDAISPPRQQGVLTELEFVFNGSFFNLRDELRKDNWDVCKVVREGKGGRSDEVVPRTWRARALGMDVPQHE